MSTTYAPLQSRIKAAVTDGIIILIVMYSLSHLFEQFESVPDEVRAGAFVFVFFLYEPISVAFFGATIGHFINDISVKSLNNQNKNISFVQAFIRNVIKLLLGWISVLAMFSNNEKQAIHDMVVKSVVIKSI